MAPGQDRELKHQDGSNIKCPGGQPRAQRKNQYLPVQSVKLPYENYVGAILNRKYRIAFLWTNREHLDVYEVTNWDDEAFQAQAFEICQLPEKLYLSRKRRLKRIKQSGTCTDDFRHGQSRYLISTRPTRGTQRHQGAKSRKDRKPSTFSEQFPSLRPYGDRNVSQPTDSRTSNARQKTYAEAASKSLGIVKPPHNGPRNTCIDGIPISRRGVRQRERRQKRREERRLKAAYLNGEQSDNP